MYSFIESNDAKCQLNIDDILEIENKFNIKFPNILKEYYIKYNGSQIKECYFSINGNDYNVNEIISLKYGKYSFEKEYEQVIENRYISNIYIPFAKDISNQSYYFNLKDNKIYYISIDDIINPIFICDSIDEFFEILNLCLDNSDIKYLDNYMISNDNPIKVVRYSDLVWVYSKKKMDNKYTIKGYLSNNKEEEFCIVNTKEEMKEVFEKLSQKSPNLLCGYNKENIAKYNRINVAYKEQKKADLKGYFVFVLFIIIMILAIIYNVFYV